MKVKIEKYRYERVKEEVEISIPEQKLFFFVTGSRVSYSIKPIWTTWNKEQYQKEEEIYSYDVIAVSRSFCNIIEKFNISIDSFPDIIKQGESNKYNRLVEAILDPSGECGRTEEQFLADYNAVLEEIKNSL